MSLHVPLIIADKTRCTAYLQIPHPTGRPFVVKRWPSTDTSAPQCKPACCWLNRSASRAQPLHRCRQTTGPGSMLALGSVKRERSLQTGWLLPATSGQHQPSQGRRHCLYVNTAASHTKYAAGPPTQPTHPCTLPLMQCDLQLPGHAELATCPAKQDAPRWPILSLQTQAAASYYRGQHTHVTSTVAHSWTVEPAEWHIWAAQLAP
jgi:hypothetical protein